MLSYMYIACLFLTKIYFKIIISVLLRELILYSSIRINVYIYL